MTTTIVVNPLAVSDFTEVVAEGTGIFDVMMRAARTHLEIEWQKNRIRGPEYAQVYLAQMSQVMGAAMQFLLAEQKTELENQLIAAQIALAEQQVLNLQDDLLTAAKQRDKLTQETANLVVQNTVLVAQECLLRAQFDQAMAAKLKTDQETALLVQKTATEKAQVSGLGVDVNSVIGRQMALYAGQTEGFIRDAEQKAAKIMVDAWTVQRTTDDSITANLENKLHATYVGASVQTLLDGAGTTL